MSDFKKLAHANWKCKYHIVCCPKYRFRILKGAVEKSVKEIIKRLCVRKKLEIWEMNVQEDHISFIISIPPKFAISEIIRFLKRKCAIKIFDKHLELKKRYWDRHFWAKGYCVSAVGLDEEKIRKYVKWQLEKDKRMEQLKFWRLTLPFSLFFLSTIFPNNGTYSWCKEVSLTGQNLVLPVLLSSK